MGAKQRRVSARAQKAASSVVRSGTQEDEFERAVAKVIQRERRNLERALAIMDCLCIADTYECDEEIDVGDVVYIVRGLVHGVANALDSVALQRAAKRPKSEPP